MTLGQIKALRLMSLIVMILSLGSLFIDLRIGTSLLLGQITEALYEYFMSKDISMIIEERILSKGLYFMSFIRNICILCAGLLAAVIFEDIFVWWAVFISLLANKIAFLIYSFK